MKEHIGMESPKSNQTRQEWYHNTLTDCHPYVFCHFSNLNTHTHAHRPIPAMPHQPYPQPIECAWQLQHFTMQHTSPPHTTTYPPHAAIHTRRLDYMYIHVPLTPHSTPQSTPTMTTTLFHLQQHPFTSPTVSTEHISKNITLLYQSTFKKT